MENQKNITEMLMRSALNNPERFASVDTAAAEAIILGCFLGAMNKKDPESLIKDVTPAIALYRRFVTDQLLSSIQNRKAEGQ